MLADPSLVDSSVSAGGDRRSPSCEMGGSTGDRSCSRSSRVSPSRGRDSHEEHRSACSQSQGVECQVLGVALSLHGPFAVAWTKALLP